MRDSIYKDFRCPECSTLNRVGFDLELGRFGFRIEGSPYSSDKKIKCINCKEPYECELTLKSSSSKLSDSEKWLYRKREERKSV
ncbi:hypothetical protein QU593_10435 [Rossellomorea marisflavi]|uniref:hypothetical protein n=1 Tax=Rossellomorea marisflavi TaxID=189381 RepID=UPI0025AF1E1E|nr:hypothetical protein [Rossellomorea marisflavi]WJV20823.1 hypothetical protein QU593_10435 [Rossellomorea marisflavi]